jgi:hypothetical protein
VQPSPFVRKFAEKYGRKDEYSKFLIEHTVSDFLTQLKRQFTVKVKTSSSPFKRFVRIINHSIKKSSES